MTRLEPRLKTNHSDGQQRQGGWGGGGGGGGGVGLGLGLGGLHKGWDSGGKVPRVHMCLCAHM